MSETTVEEETAVYEPTVVDLPNGMPCFIGDVDEIIDVARAQGYTIFYVLGQKKTTTGTGAFAKTLVEPKLFKVVTNIIGSAVCEVQEDFKFVNLHTQAWFSLPDIPVELINDIDDFFRMVENKHGTEAIVLFTFDRSYLGNDNESDGWGVAIPKQKNTAGHCNYDHQSALEDIPDEKMNDVFIVGSAHSHPSMGSAFASGTDHDDQADFDGIHITFSWKRGSKETDYHCELQMQGTAFKMDAKDIFTALPSPPENDHVAHWMDKVEKAPTVIAGKTTGTGKTTTTGGTYSDESGWKHPLDCPSPRRAAVVVDLVPQEKSCPVCLHSFSEDELSRRRCNNCMVFLVRHDETLEDVIESRQKKGMPVEEIRHDSKISNLPLVYWHRSKLNGTYKEDVEKIRAGGTFSGGGSPK